MFISECYFTLAFLVIQYTLKKTAPVLGGEQCPSMKFHKRSLIQSSQSTSPL
jgi:hypothetical protein